jgi:hypothetical protein
MTKIRVVMLSPAKHLPEGCLLHKNNGRTLQKRLRMTKIRVVMLSDLSDCEEKAVTINRRCEHFLRSNLSVLLSC